VQALHDGDNQDAAWAFVREQGYEFSFSEFLQAQQECVESLENATPQ